MTTAQKFLFFSANLCRFFQGIKNRDAPTAQPDISIFFTSKIALPSAAKSHGFLAASSVFAAAAAPNTAPMNADPLDLHTPNLNDATEYNLMPSAL